MSVVFSVRIVYHGKQNSINGGKILNYFTASIFLEGAKLS